MALLVYDRPIPVEPLRLVLESMPLKIRRVRTCYEATLAIAEAPPDVIFTDTQLPDGTWRQVLIRAENGPRPINVLVVGHPNDLKFDLPALEHEAFGFLLPPFELSHLYYIVDCAVRDAGKRRMPEVEERESDEILPPLGAALGEDQLGLEPAPYETARQQPAQKHVLAPTTGR